MHRIRSTGLAAALVAVSLLTGCGTTKVIAPPVPTPREPPINSLALEQCVRENGPEQCTADGQ